MLKELTSSNFEQEVVNASTPVLVDFWAPWCGPCKQLAPILEKVANDTNHVKFVKVNTDEYGEIADRYGVMGMPTLMMFKNGQPVDQSVGFVPENQLRSFLQKNM